MTDTPPPSRRFVLRSEDDTRRVAEALARQPALRHAFVALHGDLGAGKTTLVRHWLRALGVAGRIKSPTYALVEPYEVPGLRIWHMDFYRLRGPDEWEDAGLRDVFAARGLKLAEWPENAAALIPAVDLSVHLTLDGERGQRHMVLHAPSPPNPHSPGMAAILQGLRIFFPEYAP